MSVHGTHLGKLCEKRQACPALLKARAWLGPRRGCRSMVLLICLIICHAMVCHLAAGCAGAPVQRNKGFSPSRSTEEALEQEFVPQRWALVVGIDSYRDRTWGSLKHAAADAQAMAAALENPSGGAFDHVILLDDPDHTGRNDILLELRRLRAELRRQDTFVFYFSGHGTAEPDASGEPLYYLVANNSSADSLSTSAIELRALLAFLSTFRTQQSLAIFDSCFAGFGRSGLSPEARDGLSRIPNPWAQLTQALERSESILMATIPGGAALEDDQLGHGVFTWALLQGLTDQRGQADANGDGALTPYELHDFARALTLERTQERQVPEAYFRLTGRGEMTLAGKLDPARTRDARVYAYGRSARAGLRLEVDGRAKGAFPRMVTIPPGRRRLRVLDGEGKVLAMGGLRLVEHGHYPLEQLVETLRAPRLWLGLGGSSQLQWSGPGVSLWGKVQPQLSLGLAGTLRDGRFRGTFGRVELTSGWALDGAWLSDDPGAQAGSPYRSWSALGLELGYGWRKGPLELLLSGQARAGILAAVSLDPALLSPDGALASQSWVWLGGGALLGQRIRVLDRLALTVREGALLIPGAKVLELEPSTEPWSGLNVQLSIGAGLEWGF